MRTDEIRYTCRREMVAAGFLPLFPILVALVPYYNLLFISREIYDNQFNTITEKAQLVFTKNEAVNIQGQVGHIAKE